MDLVQKLEGLLNSIEPYKFFIGKDCKINNSSEICIKFSDTDKEAVVSYYTADNQPIEIKLSTVLDAKTAKEISQKLEKGGSIIAVTLKNSVINSLIKQGKIKDRKELNEFFKEAKITSGIITPGLQKSIDNFRDFHNTASDVLDEEDQSYRELKHQLQLIDVSKLEKISSDLETLKQNNPDLNQKITEIFEILANFAPGKALGEHVRLIGKRLELDDAQIFELTSYYTKEKSEAALVPANDNKNISEDDISTDNTTEDESIEKESDIKTLSEILKEIKLVGNDKEERSLTEIEKAALEEKIKKIDNAYQEYKSWNKSKISSWFSENKGKLRDESICDAIAVMMRAHEIATFSKSSGRGQQLRDTQKAAILTFIGQVNTDLNSGHISQINTGEGKTTIISIVQALRVLQGYKGHIITSNGVLAAENVNNRQKFYDLLGITVAHNNPQNQNANKDKLQNCYEKDIVYGSMSNFQFDWLRELDNSKESSIDFGKTWVMLDEIDSLLIDQGGNLAQLSYPFPGMESLRYIYINIWQELQIAEEEYEKKDEALAKEVKNLSEYGEEQSKIIENCSNSIKEKIIKKGIKEKIIKKVIPKHLHDFVDKNIDKWIDNALIAKYQYKPNVEYKIAEGPNGDKEIVPLDNANTGTSMANTILSNGLHQFLQIKHNLRVTYESLTSSYVSNLCYIKKYGSKLSGVTGTLGSEAERKLLGSVFNLGFSTIPPYKVKIFQEFPGAVIEDEVFHKQLIKATLSNAVKGTAKGVVTSLVVEKISKAVLMQMMQGLKPLILDKVKATVTIRINNMKDTINKLKKDEVSQCINQLFQSSGGKDTAHVVKEVAFGVLRHGGNWKAQLGTLVCDTIITGVQIGTCTGKICDKFSSALDKLTVVQSQNLSDQESDQYCQEIVDRISQQLSNEIYNNVIAITNKALITIPKALWARFKEKQEHKKDEEAAKEIRKRLDEIAAAPQNAACVHDAVAETLGCTPEDLINGTNLAPSEEGLSITDAKDLYKKTGIETVECNTENAVETMKKNNSDRCVLFLKGNDKPGHAVPLLLKDDKLMVKSGDSYIPLEQYKEQNGYTESTALVPKGLNAENINQVMHTLNHNQIINSRNKLEYADKGEGQKFGGCVLGKGQKFGGGVLGKSEILQDDTTYKAKRKLQQKNNEKIREKYKNLGSLKDEEVKELAADKVDNKDEEDRLSLQKFYMDKVSKKKNSPETIAKLQEKYDAELEKLSKKQKEDREKAISEECEKIKTQNKPQEEERVEQNKPQEKERVEQNKPQEEERVEQNKQAVAANELLKSKEKCRKLANDILAIRQNLQINDGVDIQNQLNQIQEAQDLKQIEQIHNSLQEARKQAEVQKFENEKKVAIKWVETKYGDQKDRKGKSKAEHRIEKIQKAKSLKEIEQIKKPKEYTLKNPDNKLIASLDKEELVNFMNKEQVDQDASKKFLNILSNGKVVGPINEQGFKHLEGDTYEMKVLGRQRGDARILCRVENGKMIFDWYLPSHDEKKVADYIKKYKKDKNKKAGNINNIKGRESILEYWLNYQESGLVDILRLRLQSAGGTIFDTTKIPWPQVLGLEGMSKKQLTHLTKEVTNLHRSKNYNHVIQPLLLHQRDNIYHWVGLIMGKRGKGIEISYLDSENIAVPSILRNSLVRAFKKSNPECQISFTQVQLEQQRYNNCGPELIENIFCHLTGTRVTQESAVPVHSMLFEDSLLDPKKGEMQIFENNQRLKLLSNRSISVIKR